MKVNWKMKPWISISAALLIGLVTGGYWYVFVAGVPQLDGPTAIAAEGDLVSQAVTYNSKLLGQPRTYGLVLPPGYNRNPQERYPVIFLLHGGHGDSTDFFKKAAILPVLQQLYQTHRLPPSIVITPDGNDDRGSSPFWDPQYINGPHGRVLSAIGDELVREVQARYRTKPGPDYWAIGGLSSGGWGALNIGLHHLNHFSVLFSHSGYFTDNSGPDNSPMTYIYKIKPADRSRIKIYLDAGQEDGKYLTQSSQFHQVLNHLKVTNTFNAFTGGHGLYGPNAGWNYWHHHLTDSLSFVGKHFQQLDEKKVSHSSSSRSLSQPPRG